VKSMGIADGMLLLDNMVVEEAAFDEKKFLGKKSSKDPPGSRLLELDPPIPGSPT